MDLIFGFFIFAIVFFVAAVILGIFAKRQSDFHLLGANADEARAVLEHSGVLQSGWKPASGEGQINIRPGFLRGGRQERPVISIDLDPSAQGTHVRIWLSAWIQNYGVMEPVHSIGVILRRNRIMKALDAVCD